VSHSELYTIGVDSDSITNSNAAACSQADTYQNADTNSHQNATANPDLSLYATARGTTGIRSRD
jgi:hypothetical protein